MDKITKHGNGILAVVERDWTMKGISALCSIICKKSQIPAIRFLDLHLLNLKFATDQNNRGKL